MSVKSRRRVTKRRSSIATSDVGYAREFEKHLEAATRRYINYLSWASLTHGRLQREITSMADTFPDSTSLMDFACEECGRPLVHQLKRGEEGYDFFGCSGCLDGCTMLYDNMDGKPVRSI